MDALYVRYFGADLQARVRSLIHDKHHGELPVGVADILETGAEDIPYLILAPTMRVPMILRDSVNAYLAARAVFTMRAEEPCLNSLTTTARFTSST